MFHVARADKRGVAAPGTLDPVRDHIAEYRVERSWHRTAHRYVCQAPDRLGRPGEVLVTEVAVPPDQHRDVVDRLVRMAAAGGEHLLEAVEVGPDPDTGGLYVATEAPPGGTLADPVDDPGEGLRLAAVGAAARAAHALHEAGLAHGAIRPATIVLGARGPVLDLPPLDAPEGHVVGANGWRDVATVDPERLGGEAPSRRSDIWSLGATLHAVLSDRPLYPGIEGDEPVTAVQRVMFTRPQTDPALPGAIRELVEACVAADPAERPPTARAFADRLAATGVAR